MELVETAIPGCHEVLCTSVQDQRGSFTKTFHQPAFEALGLRTDWKEEFYSVSARDVLRGMHFQTPPCDHAKLVYCLQGEVDAGILWSSRDFEWPVASPVLSGRDQQHPQLSEFSSPFHYGRGD